MSLVDSSRMLADARLGRYAVAAFNIENMEMAQAVIWEAEELKSPVICAVSQNAMKYASADLYAANVRVLADSVSVPVALHVDHAETMDTVQKALRGGFTSIMIDGSKLDFEENCALTGQVVGICRLFGIPVEGELGPLGGKADALPDSKLVYTDPEDARVFAETTGVSSLAVAIGTAHGIYKDKPRLDYVRLAEIRDTVDVPLVLHGASGLSAEQVARCIENGICKVNYATELRIAYTDAVRNYLKEFPDVFDPKKYSQKGRDAVRAVVREKILSLGSRDKAPRYGTEGR